MATRRDDVGGPLRAPRRSGDGLDDLDRALVARLRKDGREGNRSLATALGASEVTIASRLRRLEDAHIMRVVAVADMAAFGRGEFALLFVRVVGRPVLDVASDLADLSDVISVTVTTGRFDVVASLLAKDHRHFGAVLSEGVGRIHGIDVLRSEMAIDVLKYESKWAQLSANTDLALELEPTDDVDELDVAIVRQLQGDARHSNRKIAANLGVVEGTVRTRLRRLQEMGAIRFQALSDVAAFGMGAHAYVGIEVEAGCLAEASEALRALEHIAVLIRSVGEFDLVAVVMGGDRWELIRFVMDAISVAPGVRHTETMESFSTIKHKATWVSILET